VATALRLVCLELPLASPFSEASNKAIMHWSPESGGCLALQKVHWAKHMAEGHLGGNSSESLEISFAAIVSTQR
jgi:hypothetical protein